MVNDSDVDFFLEFSCFFCDPTDVGNLISASSVHFSSVAQSCPTLCDPMDWSLPGSSVHGIFQARVLEWVANPQQMGNWKSDFNTVGNDGTSTSLVMWWLRLHVPHAGGLGLIPGQGTRSCMPPLKTLHATTKTGYSKKNKTKQTKPVISNTGELEARTWPTAGGELNKSTAHP